MNDVQFDLFGAGPPPPKRAMAVQPQPARPALQDLVPPAPSVAWARLVIAAGTVGVTVKVSARWTGVVAESLQAGGGRTLLYANGEMHGVAVLPSMAGRFVFLDPARAELLHQTHPIILTFGHWGVGRYRLAKPGEAAPAALQRGWEDA